MDPNKLFHRFTFYRVATTTAIGTPPMEAPFFERLVDPSNTTSGPNPDAEMLSRGSRQPVLLMPTIIFQPLAVHSVYTSHLIHNPISTPTYQPHLLSNLPSNVQKPNCKPFETRQHTLDPPPTRQ